MKAFRLAYLNIRIRHKLEMWHLYFFIQLTWANKGAVSFLIIAFNKCSF